MSHHHNHGSNSSYQPGDSFFTRVFGHHSSHESSRAGSPTAQLAAAGPRPHKTVSTSTHTHHNGRSSSSRHSRNSSAGTIATVHCYSPTETLPPPASTHGQPRRRSFDSPHYTANNTLNEPVYPVVSRSSNTPSKQPQQQVQQQQQQQQQSQQQNVRRTQVPFPRGGRHIGEPETPQPRSNKVQRSNSADYQKYDNQDNTPNSSNPPSKRRHLFPRFGKKKHSTDTRTHRQHETSSSTSLASTVYSGMTSSTQSTQSSTTHSSHSTRKKSNDTSYRIYTTAHPLDLPVHEDSWRYPHRYYPPMSLNASHDKRKTSATSARKGKDQMRPGRANQKEIELDQNFGSMDGIVNPDYYASKATAILPSQVPHQPQQNWEPEQWAPPDSWAVQLPAVMSEDGETVPPTALTDDDAQEYDEYAMDENDKYDVPRRNFCIRIFRPDATFGTLQVPLNATTTELLNKLAGKFFLSDKSKYNLVIRRHKLERILQSHERPVHIQKILLEQMGYTEQDRIEEVGLEDNSYLLRFVFGPNVAQTLHEEPDTAIAHHVDLKGRSLPTIPIFLYKHASHIVSLDVSKNLMMEIPVDFVQMCKNLKSLTFADNELPTVPASVPHMRCLEHLDMSGNRLRDIQSARLEELEQLVTLRLCNNRLDALPLTLSSLQCLTVLSISNNHFVEFPDVICHLTHLDHLDISFNKITAFPDEIGNLTNLVRLYAIANRLNGALPPSFSKLERLQLLDLRQNLITDIEVLSQLSNLETVLVDYNAMSIVNSGFKNLKRLEMYKNHLTHFNLGSPQTFGNAHLTFLNISNCKLSSLPQDVFQNTLALEEIVLDNNTLNSIPASIGKLKRLARLSIQGNSLDSLPAEISNLGELKRLDVQKNNLKALPKEIWLCPSLSHLNCSSNLLKSFPQPYSVPGVALHLPLAPEAEAVVTPSVMANAADGALPTPLHSHAGQGVVPTTGAPAEPHLPPADPTAGSPVNGQPPNFNPPSFFASPRNHPPPLSLSLRQLFMGDNHLSDEVWSPLSWFLELRTLNLSFNYLTEMLPEGFYHQHLYELYLSGNQLTSLPADDIEKLSYLRVLAVNGNKLQTLPAEIGKLRKLLVLDVGNNMLKYNIANWPYDWNWNWNRGLKYLNLSGNKRLEIKKSHPDMSNPKDKELSDFSALTRLRMLGLMDITILGVSVLDEFFDRRVRTSPSEVNSMGYGIADWLGPSDHLASWDLVMPRFRNKDDECIFGLFSGRKPSKSGCKLTKYLNDNFTYFFMTELRRLKQDDSIVFAMRRTFLALEKGLANNVDERDSGASVVVCYIVGTKLYVANVGDALAVISRNNGQAFEITQKHIPLNPSEISRIRAAGGFVSNDGRLNNELNVSRSFGHLHLIPVVNANPYVSTIDLTEDDEFVIMASQSLWDRMSYQAAVDIARTEKDDLMAAAQKLRDFAITYGADDSIMVMVIDVSDLFDKRDKRHRRGLNMGGARGDGAMLDDVLLGKSKRRGKDEILGDSTLARLDREVPPPINQVALVFTDIKSSTSFWETQPENMRSAIKIHDGVMRRTLRSVGGYEVKTEGDAFMVCFQNITAALLWCFTVQLQLLEADWPAGILESADGREIEKDGVVIYRGLSVRMGIHWGMPVFERNPITNRMDYFGPVVNKASRICNAADGGQICVSSDVVAALRNFPGVFEDEVDELGVQTTSNDTSLIKSAASPATPMPAASYSVHREMQQLKRLGFHVVELGERRLKGLETPEMLSFVYPKQLSGRMELDKSEIMAARAAAAASTSPTPTTVLDEVPAAPTPHMPLPPPPPPSSTETDTLPEAATAVATTKDPRARTIDPSLVCALSNLAIRLERVTAGSVLSHSHAGSSIQSKYTSSGANGNPQNIVTTATTGLGKWLDIHIKEEASDEELMTLMENFVARVENAASSLYLQKVGRFAGVLEKLGDAIEIDPSHILRALQMYADVAALTDPR